VRIINTYMEEFGCYLVEVFVRGNPVPYAIFLSDKEVHNGN
jgi:hypothetical protein